MPIMHTLYRSAAVWAGYWPTDPREYFHNNTANQDGGRCTQAMAAYRTAARLFPGLHLPLVGMGMEYQRMNNLHLAEQMFGQVGTSQHCHCHHLVSIVCQRLVGLR